MMEGRGEGFVGGIRLKGVSLILFVPSILWHILS